MSLNGRVGQTEGYSRLNSVLWHKLENIPQREEGENAGLAAFKFCQWIVDQINALFEGKLGNFKLSLENIDTAHVLKTKSGKNDVVIVKFVRRIVRNLYWYNKKELAGSDVSITEHLTEYNLNLLKAAKSVIDRKNVWTNQCTVFVKIGNQKHSIHTKADLIKLMGTNENITMQDTYLDLYNGIVNDSSGTPFTPPINNNFTNSYNHVAQRGNMGQYHDRDYSYQDPYYHNHDNYYNNRRGRGKSPRGYYRGNRGKRW